MPHPVEVRNVTPVQRRSAIKPQLINVSTSGTLLDGVVVERNRERANVDIDSRAVKASHHRLVVHAGVPARLDWRLNGSSRGALFSEGDAIVNPQGVFVAPRWSAEVELLLLAFSPLLVNRVGEELGRGGTVELVPHVHFHDHLIRHLAQGLIGEFERGHPPDRVYAETLAHTLVAHLVRHNSVARLKNVAFKRGL